MRPVTLNSQRALHDVRRRAVSVGGCRRASRRCRAGLERDRRGASDPGAARPGAHHGGDARRGHDAINSVEPRYQTYHFSIEVPPVDQLKFSHTALHVLGTMRSFTSLTQIEKEMEDARVWGGIHFRSTDGTPPNSAPDRGAYDRGATAAALTLIVLSNEV